jgi:hypothetical protein
MYYSNIYPTRCNVTQYTLSGNCLNVSGDTITHNQERKQLYLQHLAFVTPLLLPAAIMEEMELQTTITASSSNGVTNTVYYILYGLFHARACFCVITGSFRT